MKGSRNGTSLLTNRRKPPNAGKGRPKGATNLATREIRALSQALFDAEYWTQTRRRLLSGHLAPAIEAKLLAYAYGEPTQTIDVPGLTDMAALLARKCIDEFHPGPTKGPHDVH